MSLFRYLLTSFARYWNGRSIRTKAIFTQIVMILVPAAICTMLIAYQILAESRNDAALTSYQYCRYIVQTLDTNARQMESMANTIAGNRNVRLYVDMPDGEKKDLFYQTHIVGLLSYAYNRYLPTQDIQIHSNVTLADFEIPGQSTLWRSAYRLWSFDGTNPQSPHCQFYYEFTSESGHSAVIAFSPLPNMIIDIASSIGSILKQECVVYASSGDLIYAAESLESTTLPELRRIAMQTPEGYSALENRRIGYALHCETLPLVFVSTQQLDGFSIPLKYLAPQLLLCLVLMLACVYFSYHTFYKNITQRVLKLSHDCESIQFDDPDSKSTQLTVSVRGTDEISRLAMSINDMLSRIIDLTHINQRQMVVSQIAAYDALAAQIQPHFIYNTLENLRMMAEANNDPQVADMLYALGRMMRLSISDANSTGNIETEMEHARLYLKLQQMRLNGKLSYQIDPVPDILSHIVCPRFLLQPIVENTIKHGFQTKKTPGNIHISAGVTHGQVYLRVQDDGAGFTADRLVEIENAMQENAPISNTRGGIGLVNVNARLKMYYGKTACLVLHSVPQKKTVCTLWLTTFDKNLPAEGIGETPRGLNP